MPRDLDNLLEHLRDDYTAFEHGRMRAQTVIEYRMAMEKARASRLLLEKIFPDDH